MRRSIPLVVIALAALAVSAASAKEPTPPLKGGTYWLETMRARYSGPPIPVRAALMKIMEPTIVLSPICEPGNCNATNVTITTPRRNRRVTLMVVAVDGLSPSTGQVELPTGLRCGRRPLKATLRITARMVDGRLTGTTEASADNPRPLCALPRQGARIPADVVRGPRERLA